MPLVCGMCAGLGSSGLNSSPTSGIDFLLNLGEVTFPLGPLLTPLNQVVFGQKVYFGSFFH